ncbi:hypothetical protein GGP86_003261 [Salinibacter ruber]|uniref:hypothetical protein n=1 Tax=Salinibacter ruber TaxID=146919 RepID=UPI0021688475|nr:hypothetical protein [Salinibacter ruber]MCS3863462.1 hypothetical protein [Salinibacter ruber]
MPAVVEEENTRRVKGKDLADMLNRSEGAVSSAARNKYFCNDYPVFEWAEMHPAGNQIRHYNVPVRFLRERLPDEEWERYGIFE